MNGLLKTNDPSPPKPRRRTIRATSVRIYDTYGDPPGHVFPFNPNPSLSTSVSIPFPTDRFDERGLVSAGAITHPSKRTRTSSPFDAMLSASRRLQRHRRDCMERDRFQTGSCVDVTGAERCASDDASAATNPRTTRRTTVAEDGCGAISSCAQAMVGKKETGQS